MRNDFGTKLERMLSRYALHNITLYLIICYAFGYLIQMVNGQFLLNLTLEPYYILRGQIWRLFTWIIVPPTSQNLFWVLIMLYFYYSIGRSLEMVWGTYRLNVYLFSGMFFTILGSFILYGASMLSGAGAVVGYGLAFSTYYINMSIFLAYAATFPDMQVLLFFIIPIKVKVLGIIYGILLVFSCVQGGLLTWVVIGSSLLNFIVFFLTSRRRVVMSPKMMRQKMQYRRATTTSDTSSTGRTTGRITKHKCATCGQTDESNPDLEFRFCSKCAGNYEYCNEHLFTHEHVK